MALNEGTNGRIKAEQPLHLLGMIAADRFSLEEWNSAGPHTIIYDSTFKRDADLYQMIVSRQATFQQIFAEGVQ